MLSVRVVHPVAPTDRPLVRALADAALAYDGFEPLADAVWRDLDAPGAGSTGLVAVDGDRPAGYLHLAPSDTEGPPHVVAGLVVDPAHRAGGGVERALLAAAADVVAAAGDGRVVLHLGGVSDDLDAAVVASGFHRVDELLQMRVPLPLGEHPRWPDGVTVRSFRPGEDDTSWLHVNNRAFHDHPDQGGWSEATLQRRLAEPWFDPAGFVLAFDADGLAGFCWTKVQEPTATDPRLGEIYVIGVDPDRHGTGLGRALTVAGLEHLATVRSCPVGMLYVDGANTAARGLYEALGFTVHRTDRVYERTVVAA